MATCQSNLKQVSLGMLMYAQDYNERLPLRANWGDGLSPYIKNYAIFTCPSYPSGTRGGYAYNAQLGGVEIKAVTNPALLVALYDAQTVAPGASASPGSTMGWNACGGASLLDPRHNAGANIGYVDGHVKWIRTGVPLQWRP